MDLIIGIMWLLTLFVTSQVVEAWAHPRFRSPLHRQKHSLVKLDAIMMRRAEIGDLPGIVALALDVFGEDEGSPFASLLNAVQERQITNGYKTRLAIAETSNNLDHNVMCIFDDSPKYQSAYGGLVGMCEISLQPNNGDTAPALPRSLLEKKRKFKELLFPYISNLVVSPPRRRQGFAQKLVVSCEKRAREWGYDEVYLHVDVDEVAAVKLYEKLQYFTVREEAAWIKFLRGYQLRYLSKRLTK